MMYNNMRSIILDLPFDTMIKIHNNGKQAILIYHPITLSVRFKDYDVNTNFQIFLRIGDDKPFRPNHLRLLIDLKLRARELPQAKEELLVAFDKIFYGKEIDYTVLPRSISQEKLLIILERIVNTGISILVGYDKIFLSNNKKDTSQ